MGQLLETIRQLVAEEKYVVGRHSSERLQERGIMEWQVVAGLEDGEKMDGEFRKTADESGRPLLIDSQRRELKRRIADDNANPDDVVPWEQVKAQTLRRLKATGK